MLGNIWLSSALIITVIYSTSAMYKSYSDAQEAKEIQENYQIISDIKTLLANQYNKNPDEVTRDEIMMHLPSGGNWEKVLLLNRNRDSNLEDDALVDVDGNFVLNESEQLKLFALRAKLKNLSYTSTEEIDVKTKDHTFQVGMSEKNIIKKNESIDKSVEKAIEHLSVDILYGGSIETPAVILEETLTNYTPYSDIYQDMKESETEVLTDEEVIERQKDYFKEKIEEKLILNENAMETKLYYLLKDEL